MFKVYNMNKYKWIEVSDTFMTGVDDLEKAVSFELWGDRLKVEYESGKELWYRDVFGTWGKPVAFA